MLQHTPNQSSIQASAHTLNTVRDHQVRCTPQARWRHVAGRPVANGAPVAKLHGTHTLERPQPSTSSRRVRRPIDRLTRRQLEVLGLMAEGHSNAAIARICYISEKAVVQHTSQIYDRLDLPNEAHAHRRVQAVVLYLAHQDLQAA